MIELNDIAYLAAFGEPITLLNGFHSNAFPTAVTKCFVLTLVPRFLIMFKIMIRISPSDQDMMESYSSFNLYLSDG